LKTPDGGKSRPPLRPEETLHLTLTVLSEATERLDRFLADQLGLSRTQAARLVGQKRVQVEGETARASRCLVRGEEVAVDLPEQDPPRAITPHDIPLDIVYEDEYLLVLDKPAGLVVHPAPGHWDDTIVNALAARGTSLGGGVEGRPGIVHRLDRDTSGLLIVARTDTAHRRLSAALAARRVRRRYAALSWGHFDSQRVTIEAPVGRHPVDRKRMTVRADGRTAHTTVQVIARWEVAELLRVDLRTGRTHQIRVHLAHAGHPVVGDPTYHGGGSRRISGAGRPLADQIERLTPRQALHAAELAFVHPMTKIPLRFRSEWPPDLGPALETLATSDRVAGQEALTYLGFFADDDG